MTTLSFKVPDRQAQAIRQRARRQRLSVSEYLRRQAAAPVLPKKKPAMARCRLTGAVIFQGAADLPPLTVASTKEILADFP